MEFLNSVSFRDGKNVTSLLHPAEEYERGEDRFDLFSRHATESLQ
jgi:hypothetical protein